MALSIVTYGSCVLMIMYGEKSFHWLKGILSWGKKRVKTQNPEQLRSVRVESTGRDPSSQVQYPQSIEEAGSEYDGGTELVSSESEMEEESET